MTADVKLRDRLFWKQDEDEEWVHRFDAERNGNEGGSIVWSAYVDETCSDEITRGALWTNWQIGASWESDWTAEWVREQAGDRPPGMYGHRVHVRRTYVTVSFGPFYLSYQRVRPRRTLPWEG